MWAAVPDEPCAQVRQCRLCAASNKQVAHDFAGWVYDDVDTCEQTSTCRRCPEPKIRREHAQFSERKLVAPDKCLWSQACPRCGHEETSTEHGDWVEGRELVDESWGEDNSPRRVTARPASG